jgi:hypothetical protein
MALTKPTMAGIDPLFFLPIFGDFVEVSIAAPN